MKTKTLDCPIVPLEYFINMDERGEFCADVRRNGETIFEIEGGEIFEDGFMRHKYDLAGLLEYMQSLSIAADCETLIRGN